MVRVACIFFLWLLPLCAGAQQAVKDFETNDWAFLANSNRKIPGQLSGGVVYDRLFGSRLHRGYSQAYQRRLNDNLFPLGSKAKGSVKCTDKAGASFSVQHKHAQDLMKKIVSAVEWHQSFNLPRVGPRFNGIPSLEEIETVDQFGKTTKRLQYDQSKFVNLLMCSNDPSIAVVGSTDIDDGAITLALGSQFASVANNEPIMWLTAGHEVAHIYQNVMMPFKYDRIDPPAGTAQKALVEGYAQASGLMFAFSKMGGQAATLKKKSIKYSKAQTKEFFMARAYNVPLFLHEGSDDGPGDLSGSDAVTNEIGKVLLKSVDDWMEQSFSYETSGFFYHLIERYFDKDPSRIKSLYLRIGNTETTNIYPAVSAFLDEVDGNVSKGLAHVLPQFLAEYATWGNYARTNDDLLKIDNWLNATFGGCEEVKLNFMEPHATADLKIAKFAGSCVDIVLEAGWAEELPEIKMFLTSEKGNVREIYAGMAEVQGLQSGDVTCFDVVEARGAKGATCLLDPVDGEVFAEAFSLGTYYMGIRHFYMGQLLAAPDKEVRLRLILTHVPSDLTGHGYLNADGEIYTLDVAAGTVAVRGGEEAAPTPQLGEWGRGFVDKGAGQLFVTGGFVPTTAEVEVPLPSMFQQMVEGGANIPGIDIIAETGAGPSMLYGFQTYSNAGEYGVFFFPERVPAYGEVGRLKLRPMGGGYFDSYGEEYAMFNPDKRSYADVFKNTPEALVYFGEVHICTYTFDELQAEIFSGRDRTPCEFGRQRTYFIESTVAFPELVPGAYRLSPMPPFGPIPPTPAYEKYKNLRLAKIGVPMGNYPDPADKIARSSGGPPDGPAPVVGRTATSTGFGENTCDCSCAAKAASGVSVCKLLCGKIWKTCEE